MLSTPLSIPLRHLYPILPIPANILIDTRIAKQTGTALLPLPLSSLLLTDILAFRLVLLVRLQVLHHRQLVSLPRLQVGEARGGEGSRAVLQGEVKLEVTFEGEGETVFVNYLFEGEAPVCQREFILVVVVVHDY